MSGIDFTDPFLDETVQRALRHPFRMLFRHQTPLAGSTRSSQAIPASRRRESSCTFPGADRR